MALPRYILMGRDNTHNERRLYSGSKRVRMVDRAAEHIAKGEHWRFWIIDRGTWRSLPMMLGLDVTQHADGFETTLTLGDKTLGRYQYNAEGKRL